MESRAPLSLRLRERPAFQPHEIAYSLTDVYAADEAFVTGTFGGLTPVHTIDGRTIGDGSQGAMTARLRDLYQAAMASEVGLG